MEKGVGDYGESKVQRDSCVFHACSFQPVCLCAWSLGLWYAYIRTAAAPYRSLPLLLLPLLPPTGVQGRSPGAAAGRS